ncbi:hypothetical protein XENTR_v10012509 [Xenopus tropicalis]|nr:hypothetical protein XENTR_v10012509 [Xenopus tropicalis]
MSVAHRASPRGKTGMLRKECYTHTQSSGLRKRSNNMTSSGNDQRGTNNVEAKKPSSLLHTGDGKCTGQLH